MSYGTGQAGRGAGQGGVCIKLLSERIPAAVVPWSDRCFATRLSTSPLPALHGHPASHMSNTCVFNCWLQLPSFDDILLVSMLGSLMSMAYCLIAFIMSATVKPGPTTNYIPAAVERSTIDKVMGIFNALTSILFAYGG